MWAAGRKKRTQRIVARRKVETYYNPKVYNSDNKNRQSRTINFKFNRRRVENILLIVAGIILVYWVFFSPYFRIKDVLVEGNETIPATSLEELIPRGQNIFLYKSENTKSMVLQQFPQIKEMAIFKGIPNAIKIQVVERDSKIVWQTMGKNYLIDPEGVVSREVVEGESLSLPVVIDNKNQIVDLNQKILSFEFINFVTILNQNFNKYSNLNINSFNIDETTFDLTVTTKEEIRVMFDTQRVADGQLLNLQSILTNYRDSIKEYIDLRVEGWGYYK